jgi:DNA primase large subunit
MFTSLAMLPIIVQVLRKIEEMKTRSLPLDVYRAQLDASIKSNLRCSNDDRIDVASHFILRAAYCRNEDLRRWFLTQECHLFRHRLESMSSRGGRGGGIASGNGNYNRDELRDFLTRNDFDLDRLSPTEKEGLRTKLLSIPGTNTVEFNVTEYYRVPFAQALELVGRRECHVHGGYAYVPLSRIVSIVAAKFRSALSRSLASAGGTFRQVVSRDEKSRIGPLLTSMNSQYTGPGGGMGNNGIVYGIDGEMSLTASNVDEMANRSMPLCMKQLHRGLQRDHKLKHQGRLQYGLFLKGAGMSLEEHTLFFQREFTRIMTGEQFNKQYAYSIRHTHGKEGKRATYTPYNCTRIILGNPPQNAAEHHGCPYRHYDDASLSALLGQLKVGNAADRDAIMAHKRDGNFQLACTRHFDAVHPGATTLEGVSLDGVGNHPNAWFSASVSYHAARSKKDGGGSSAVKAEGGV